MLTAAANLNVRAAKAAVLLRNSMVGSLIFIAARAKIFTRVD